MLRRRSVGLPWIRARSIDCIRVVIVFDDPDAADQALGGGPVVDRLADQMSSAWIDFARTGNPNGAGVPQWPAYTAARPAMMVFAEHSAARIGYDADLIRLTTPPKQSESAAGARSGVIILQGRGTRDRMTEQNRHEREAIGRLGRVLGPDILAAVQALYSDAQQAHAAAQPPRAVDEPYGDHPRQALDLYAPTGLDRPAPVLLWPKT